jgi:ArsR family transcriptional regulator, virulence genes transcriptional regulator
MPAAKRLLRKVDRGVIERAAGIIKLLGHRERLMILEALEQGELTVGEICEVCDLEQAVCSQHLGRLRRSGVVACRKDGLNVHYQIIEPKVYHILHCIRACDVPSR